MATALSAVPVPSAAEVQAARLEFAAARYARILNGPEPVLPREVFDVLNAVAQADTSYRALTGKPLFDHVPTFAEVLANRRQDEIERSLWS